MGWEGQVDRGVHGCEAQAPPQGLPSLPPSPPHTLSLPRSSPLSTSHPRGRQLGARRVGVWRWGCGSEGAGVRGQALDSRSKTQLAANSAPLLN
eukprot:632129-Rhodomonas_salina.1